MSKHLEFFEYNQSGQTTPHQGKVLPHKFSIYNVGLRNPNRTKTLTTNALKETYSTCIHTKATCTCASQSTHLQHNVPGHHETLPQSGSPRFLLGLVGVQTDTRPVCAADHWGERYH